MGLLEGEVALVNDGEEVEIEDFGSSALEWLNEISSELVRKLQLDADEQLENTKNEVKTRLSDANLGDSSFADSLEGQSVEELGETAAKLEADIGQLLKDLEKLTGEKMTLDNFDDEKLTATLSNLDTEQLLDLNDQVVGIGEA